MLNRLLAGLLTLDSFFYAIAAVESCNRNVNNRGHIGVYQISYAYWKDSNTPGKWQDVTDERYARQVMLNYFRRYASEALQKEDFQVLARIHHGGPDGAVETETIKYWTLIKEYLDDTRKRCG